MEIPRDHGRSVVPEREGENPLDTGTLSKSRVPTGGETGTQDRTKETSIMDFSLTTIFVHGVGVTGGEWDYDG